MEVGGLKLEKKGLGFPGFLAKYKRPKAFAIRDFPSGCCIDQQTVSQVITDSIPREMLGNGEPSSVVTTEFSEATRFPKVMEDSGLTNCLTASDNGDAEFSKKLEMKRIPDGPAKYKRRKISAIRDFPLGCGRVMKEG